MHLQIVYLDGEDRAQGCPGPWPMTPETGTHKHLHSVTLSWFSVRHSWTSGDLCGELRPSHCGFGGKASASMCEVVKQGQD